MQKYIFFAFNLIILTSQAQTFSNYYITEVPLSSQYNFRDVAVLSTGDLLVSCEYLEFGVYWMTGLIKMTDEGQVIWAKKFPNSITATGRVLTSLENEEGNYLQLSLYWEYADPHAYARLIEISPDGLILWSKEIDLGIPPDFSNFCYGSMELMESGDLQLVIGAPADVILVRTSSTGELIWGKKTSRFVLPVVNFSGLDWINLSSGDQLYSYKSSDESVNLIKLTNEGDEIWTRRYLIGENPIPKSMVELPDGSILLAGYTTEGVSFLLKVDSSDGTINWGKEFLDFEQSAGSKMELSMYGDDVLLTLSGNEKFRCVKLTVDGEILITKQLEDVKPIFEFARIHHIDSEDFLLGTQREGDFHYAFFERTNSVFEMSCISVISSLTNTMYEDYSSDTFIPAFDEFEAITSTTYSFIDFPIEAPDNCISGGLTPTVLDAKKILLFPNPTNGKLHIEASTLTNFTAFQVFDTAGQLLLEGQLTAGQNEVNLETLENGLYFLRLIAGDYTRQFTIEIQH